MGMPCRDGCRSTGGPFSVPLGYGGDVRSVRGWSWPRLNPGDVAPQPSAEIDRRRMQGQLGSCSPQLQLVAVTVTAMAVVAAERHVHGEGAPTTLGRRLMQGAAAVPLRSRATHRLEGEQVEYLRHRDLGTQSVEVDTRHGTSSSGGPGPFRSLFSLEGERERSSWSQSGRCQPAAVRRRRPARSSDSRTAPKRWFLTASVSRSLARVRTTPGASRASTWSCRLRRG